MLRGLTRDAAKIMSPEPSVFIVFGAAVWEGGVASKAMRRRIDGALLSARCLDDALFLVSGGECKYPPSEACVMAKLLEDNGIPSSRVLLDEAATNTIDSVRNCVAILQSLPKYGEVVVCSDIYHIPRCRWLFKIYGITTRPGRVASGQSQNKLSRWLYYYLREVGAIPVDTVIALSGILGRWNAGG